MTLANNNPSNNIEDAGHLGIDPADMSIAKEIMDFDPVYDVPSTTKIDASIRLPTEVGLTALSPEQQAPIKEKLSTVPQHMQEAEERRLVQEALYENSFRSRVIAGAGPDASPYQAEMLGIANESRIAKEELLDLSKDLASVDGYKMTTDATTGEPKPVPIDKVQGERRRGMESRIAQLTHRIDELEHGEGPRRLKIALQASIEKRKSLETERHILDTAKKRAEEMEVEERIEKRAASLRNMKRDYLG